MSKGSSFARGSFISLKSPDQENSSFRLPSVFFRCVTRVTQLTLLRRTSTTYIFIVPNVGYTFVVNFRILPAGIRSRDCEAFSAKRALSTRRISPGLMTISLLRMDPPNLFITIPPLGLLVRLLPRLLLPVTYIRQSSSSYFPSLLPSPASALLLLSVLDHSSLSSPSS